MVMSGFIMRNLLWIKNNLKRASALAALLWLAIFAITNQLLPMKLLTNFFPALKEYRYAIM